MNFFERSRFLGYDGGKSRPPPYKEITTAEGGAMENEMYLTFCRWPHLSDNTTKG